MGMLAYNTKHRLSAHQVRPASASSAMLLAAGCMHTLSARHSRKHTACACCPVQPVHCHKRHEQAASSMYLVLCQKEAMM